MSRTQRYLRGIQFGYLNQLASLAVGLWMTRFLLGHLGSQQYGLWLVAIQLLAWLLLLDFGVIGLIPRELAAAVGRSDDRSGPGRLLAFAAQLAVWQSVVVGAAAYALWLLLPREWEGLRPALGPTLLAFVVLYPLRVLPAVIEGLQDLAWHGVAQLVGFLVGAGVTVALVLRGHALPSLAWGWIAQQTVVCALAAGRIATRHRGVLPARWFPLSRAEASGWLRRGAWLTVNQLASILLTGADIVLVGKFLGADAVVAYACTGKAVSFLIHQPRMLVLAAVPGLSQLRASESIERVRQACISLVQATLGISGVLTAGVLAANAAFVTVWVGEEHFMGAGLSALIAVNMLVRHLCTALSMATFAFGDERRIAWTALADGTVAILLGAVGLHLFGYVGAPLGTLGGILLVSVPSHFRAIARHLGVPLSALLQPLRAWAIRAAVALAVAALASRALPELAPLARFLLLGAGATTVYAVLVGPTALQPPLETYVRPRLSAYLARSFLSSKSGDAR